MDSVYLQVAVVITAIKLLLIPTYHSTDFEVHRNWLAVTQSTPVSKWYYEDTSEWTLDYPPLFAWLEWLLSQVAKHVDADMLVVENLNYASEATVLFQRLTVIVLDSVFMWAAFAIASRQQQNKGAAAGHTVYVLLVANAGLLLVDHIHFQYNGVMLGVLLWSIHFIQEQQHLAAALLFVVLLNMKHLFVYAAPVYFVYLLRHYCVGRHALRRFMALGVCVAGVSAASFGPFIAMGQLPQVMKRMFPFSRGLCHSYWAANFWALYSFMDKVLAAALPRFGVHVDKPIANMAGGAVGVAKFVVLPQIEPKVAMLMVLLALLPCLITIWQRPRPHAFAHAVAYASMCGFMFGYHVHEKAVLPALVPLALSAVRAPRQAGQYLVLSTAGIYGLLPLLFRPQEYLPKVALLLAYIALSLALLRYVHRKALAKHSAYGGRLLGFHQKLYLVGFLALELYCTFLHNLLPGKHLEFLPLMLTSVYCSLGCTWLWVAMLCDSVQGLPLA